MTEQELQEIERRAQLWREGWDQKAETAGWAKREALPALVAEVRRLRAALKVIADPEEERGGENDEYYGGVNNGLARAAGKAQEALEKT